MIYFLLILFTATSLHGQTPDNKPFTLPKLGVKDKAIETTMIKISDYIRNKPKGLRFPITKIVFTQVKGGLSYRVEGIDNTWANVFNYDEISYGYAVVANRLFVIMSKKNEIIDLNNLFWLDYETKTFSRNSMPPTGVTKRPMWTYDYVDGVIQLINGADLDVLEK